MYVLDVSSPAAPLKLSEAIRTRGVVQGLCYQPNRLYIAAGAVGLEVWDVTNPGASTRLGYCDTPGSAHGVAVAGNYAYVADEEAGMRVIEFYGAGVQETMNDERATMNSLPTIVHGVLMVSGANGAWRQANGVLLDAAGREVMELHFGANDVSRLAPGVYFGREAVSGGRSAASVRKVIIGR